MLQLTGMDESHEDLWNICDPSAISIRNLRDVVGDKFIHVSKV